MDNGSTNYWIFDDGTDIIVGERVFYDHEQALTWLVLDEITLEPVSGDPDELVYEPVFWCSTKDSPYQYEFNENEIKELDRANI